MKSNEQMFQVRDRSRIRSVAKIVVFDLAVPLAAYSLLGSAGQVLRWPFPS